MSRQFPPCVYGPQTRVSAIRPIMMRSLATVILVLALKGERGTIWPWDRPNRPAFLRLVHAARGYRSTSRRSLQGFVLLQNLYLANELLCILVSTNIVMFAST